ncbi:MAG: FtsX-like permease family protein [Proteobacteria bacterium]|nr:FtsX-like permease family protein [Pseudomonadota bacterium]
MQHLSALLSVAAQSLRYRLSGVALTVASVALSVFVLLGVEHVRQEARSSFASTISGVDLIVGARTGEINLLLLSVFRIGSATANVSWESVEEIREQANVAWAVPISLGDSHRNFRVLGTTPEFFQRYKYGSKQSLELSDGKPFQALADVVLGARVAADLLYQVGDSIVLSHGMADTSFTHHDNLPFTVSGILTATGTPIDNALFVGLDSIAAMHADESSHSTQTQGGAEVAPQDHHEDEHGHEHEHGHEDEHAHDDEHDHEHEHGHADEHAHDDEHGHEDEHGHDDEHGHEDERHEHPPIGTVTAVLVGLNDAITTLRVKRWVDEYAGEALLAILPGVALTQLWELLGNVEAILLGISVLVFLSSLLGLNAMLLASMRERRGEIQVLRSIGAPSMFVLGLLLIESLLIVTIGVVLAILALLLAIAVANGLLSEELGLMISSQIFNESNVLALVLIYATTLLVTVVPALQAYGVSKGVGGNVSVGNTSAD